MILVDTSVWIEFLGGYAHPHAALLEASLESGEDVCVCGIVLAEVLQGIRSDEECEKTRRYFESLMFLPMTYATFIDSAEIYRSLRKKGITVRKPVDCMIASVAIEHDVPLLHNDRDFDQIAKHTRLQVKDVKANRV